MNIDVNALWRTVQGIINGFLSSLPRLILALVIIALFYGIGRVVRTLVQRDARRRGDHGTLELAIGRLAQAGIIGLGILIAFTAAFPSFTPASLISALGVGGVAIGFAFKDIFQNFLAGILILITKPFRVGDSIIFGEYEGTVEDIHARATYLASADGRRIIIPNSDLYTCSVTVNTAYERRRWQYEFSVNADDDVEAAKAIVLRALEEIANVEPDPKADVTIVAVTPQVVTIRARWWTKTRGVDAGVAQSEVLARVKRDFAEAKIGIAPALAVNDVPAAVSPMQSPADVGAQA